MISQDVYLTKLRPHASLQPFCSREPPPTSRRWGFSLFSLASVAHAATPPTAPCLSRHMKSVRFNTGRATVDTRAKVLVAKVLICYFANLIDWRNIIRCVLIFLVPVHERRIVDIHAHYAIRRYVEPHLKHFRVRIVSIDVEARSPSDYEMSSSSSTTDALTYPASVNQSSMYSLAIIVSTPSLTVM